MVTKVTCVFQPQPISDNQKRVACVVTGEFIGSQVKFASTIFIVDLLYPPLAPSAMTSLDSASFLRTGDVINCTVRGGKPAVTSVTFKCTEPLALPDQDDVVEENDVTGVTSVVSAVRVRTSSRGESRSLSCRCSAKWVPEESLYPMVTSYEFPTEYKATITNFTFNGVKTALTVTENDVNNVVALTCFTDGRPTPNITLSKMGADGVLSQQADVTVSVMTLYDVSCEMTGLYICTVNNGIARPDQKLASLVVLCGPRAENSSVAAQNEQSPPTLTHWGLSFRVVSNPVPHTSAYTILNATTAAIGSLAPSLQSARLFVTSCVKVKDADHMALCKVTPRRVTSQQLGIYAVTVSNRLGSYDFHFKVEKEIQFDEYVNPAFVSASAIDVRVQNQAELPRQSSSNLSTSSNQYDDIVNDYVTPASLHPPQATEDTGDADRPQKKCTPRVSFQIGPEPVTQPYSLDPSPRTPRNFPNESARSQKSPRYKANESSQAQKSPRRKLIKTKAAPKSPRNKVNESRFPQESPRKSPATSPPTSPRNNAFMTDEDGATFDERPSTAMSGDYAEIESSPRNGGPDTIAKPRSRRSEYVDLADPYPIPSPRQRKTNDVQAGDINTPASPLPRGSVRGKARQGKARQGKAKFFISRIIDKH
ncbi:hypothetical protein ACOMHN_021248 [Nucella lapillus]